MRYEDDSNMIEGRKYSFLNKQNNVSFIATLMSKNGGDALTLLRDDRPVTLNLPHRSVFENFNVSDVGERNVRWDEGPISSPSGDTFYTIDMAERMRRQYQPRGSGTLFGHSHTAMPDVSVSASERSTSEVAGRREQELWGRPNWNAAYSTSVPGTRENTAANRNIPPPLIRHNAVSLAYNPDTGQWENYGGGRKRTRKSRKSRKSKKSRKSRKSKKSRKTRK